MRIAVPFILILCFACGGSLSSEQRKKIRENMEAKALKKVSDLELTEAALAYGRNLAKVIETKDKNLVHRRFLDSLGKAYGVEILAMKPSDSLLRSVEKQIIEAYTSDTNLTGVGDNLQKMGADSLLYTKPIMSERPDGSVQFNRALAIRMPKKQVILSIKK